MAEENIAIKKIVPTQITFSIKGTSPLIMHAWSQKALAGIRDPQGRKKLPKTKRDPKAEGEAAAHVTADGKYGIPAGAIKKCLINAAHKDYGIEKTLVRKSVFVLCKDENNIIEIKSDEPVIREDIVRIGINQTDLRYRPEFRNWSAVITLEVDYEILNENDIINLAERAGFGVGLLEWRPEKGGDWGRFEVDRDAEVKISKRSV